MKKITKLTEDDLNRIVKKVLSEQTMPTQTGMPSLEECFSGLNFKFDNFKSCKALKESIKLNRKQEIKEQLRGCFAEFSAFMTKDVNIFDFSATAATVSKANEVLKCMTEKLKPSVVQY